MTDVNLNLKQLNIVAKEFDKTVEFYRRLGATITDDTKATDKIRHARAVLPNGFILEFDNLALARTYNAAWRQTEGSSPVMLGFSLPTREAVDQHYTELVSAGYVSRQAPYDAFWGSRYAIVTDPDGNDIGLMSPEDEGHRSWPPKDSPSS